MSVYYDLLFFPSILLLRAAEDVTNSGNSGFPVEILAGPYGFLVMIFTCSFWGLREWRKGREQDVNTYKQKADQAEKRAEQIETKADTEAQLWATRVVSLQAELTTVRDQHYREKEINLAKYYAARQMLLAAGVPKEEIP